LIGSALQRNDYEDAIRLSETRNRIILSALPDLLIRVDQNGIILDYSANPSHPLYVHRDLISGKNLSETWPEETVSRILGDCQVNGFQSQRVLETFTLPFSGEEYEARLYPIGPREALIVIRDVTEQARLNQMKSDFINRASHELRTPVTSAILMSELIQEGGTKEELDEYWRALRSELNRQKILIDRLLTAGRLESGMTTLEKIPLNVISILAESSQAVIPIAQGHIDKAGLSDRIRVRAGDLCTDRLGEGYNLVFVSAICHMLSEEENQDLVRRCYAALAPAGRLVIQDFILEPDKTAPKSAALFSLNMLVGTRAGASYSEPEYSAWLREAGFEEVRRIRLPGPSGLMLGTRR